MKENDINFKLPLIDINKIKERYDLNELEETIVLGILYEPENGVGILRATRPKQSGELSWVWRNIIMFASPETKFHTIAPSLSRYLSEIQNPEINEAFLHRLVDKVISTIPNEELPGLMAWRESLGL